MNNLKKIKKKYEELGKEIERLENEKKNKRWRADLDNINTYYELMDLAEKRLKAICQIYYLNENFLEIALERIRKERLEKLFKEK